MLAPKIEGFILTWLVRHRMRYEIVMMADRAAANHNDLG